MNASLICDLDNTIADDEWRRGLVTAHADRGISFAAYHAACERDAFKNRHLIQASQGAQATCRLIIISSRPERYRQQTEAWLSRHGITAWLVLLRPDHRQEPSKQWKSAALDLLRNTHGVALRHIVCAYDNNPGVVAMYRAHGIPAVCCAVYGPYATEEARYTSVSD